MEYICFKYDYSFLVLTIFLILSRAFYEREKKRDTETKIMLGIPLLFNSDEALSIIQPVKYPHRYVSKA